MLATFATKEQNIDLDMADVADHKIQVHRVDTDFPLHSSCSHITL